MSALFGRVFVILLCCLSVCLEGASLLVVKGVSAKSQGELNRQAQKVKKAFTDVGVEVDEVEETALTAEHLTSVRLVILPQNPSLSDACCELLEDFTSRGGRVLAFYPSSARLCRLLGLEPAEFVKREQFGSPTAMRLTPAMLPGLPETMPQRSWNGMSLVPAETTTQVLGVYVDAQGKDTGYHALTMNEKGFCFSHILQYKSEPEILQTLLTLVATVVPDVWREPAKRQLEALGKIGGCQNLADVARLLTRIPAGEHSHQLATAIDLEQQARQDLAWGRLREAYLKARQANVLSRQAYQATCPPRASELRGVWIHNPHGLADWGWDKTVKVLKDHGFNAIFPNFLWGYTADYNSQVLPQHPLVAKKGDPLRQCLEACRKYGIEIHVWKVCWNLGHRATPEQHKQMIEAKRTQKTFAGKDSRFLAPHLKENQDLEVEALLEVVKNYDVDGIHLDYIRYPEQDCDYSDSARQAFEQHLGRKVANWPEDCGRNGRLRKAFNAWRRGNINALVERLSRELHAAKPSLKLSAAVFGSWESARESIAQDAQMWVDRGWLDFICPMNYTQDREFFTELVQRHVSGTGARLPLYVGLGTWLHQDAAMTVEQIELTRQLGADGFICFQHTLPFATEILPQLSKNATSRYAVSPLPHQSPRMRTTLAASGTPLLEGAYAFPEPITLTFDFVDGFKPANGTVARLLIDGNYPQRQPRVSFFRRNATTLVATFIPPRPGNYRFEISDDRTFVCRSQNIPVLTPEQVRQKLIAEGIPQFAKNGLPRVAVWQHDAYGAPGITKTLKEDGRFDVAPLWNLKPETLKACDVVVIPQPRRHAEWFSERTAAVLHDYIRAGGAVLVTHAMAGLRNFPVICPEIVDFALSLPTRKWLPVKGTPLAAGLEAGKEQTSTFVDITGIVPAAQGRVMLAPVLSDKQQTPSAKKAAAAVGGVCGTGRFLAIGLGLGIAAGDTDCDLPPAETQLLRNAVHWLGER